MSIAGYFRKSASRGGKRGANCRRRSWAAARHWPYCSSPNTIKTNRSQCQSFCFFCNKTNNSPRLPEKPEDVKSTSAVQVHIRPLLIGWLQDEVEVLEMWIFKYWTNMGWLHRVLNYHWVSVHKLQQLSSLTINEALKPKQAFCKMWNKKTMVTNLRRIYWWAKTVCNSSKIMWWLQ